MPPIFFCGAPNRPAHPQFFLRMKNCRCGKRATHCRRVCFRRKISDCVADTFLKDECYKEEKRHRRSSYWGRPHAAFICKLSDRIIIDRLLNLPIYYKITTSYTLIRIPEGNPGKNTLSWLFSPYFRNLSLVVGRYNIAPSCENLSENSRAKSGAFYNLRIHIFYFFQ